MTLGFSQLILLLFIGFILFGNIPKHYNDFKKNSKFIQKIFKIDNEKSEVKHKKCKKNKEVS